MQADAESECQWVQLPAGNCSRFEQCESTETVYVLVIPTRLGPLLGFVQAAVGSFTRRGTHD
jgi:hypothetical protein